MLIVATDWDQELRGAAYVIELSRQGGPVHVDVLCASAPIIAWRTLRFWAYGRVISWQREQGQRVLDAYRDRLRPAGVAATCHLCIEDPAKAIARLAAQIPAERIVLPTPPPAERPPFGYWWQLYNAIRQSGMPIVLA